MPPLAVHFAGERGGARGGGTTPPVWPLLDEYPFVDRADRRRVRLHRPALTQHDRRVCHHQRRSNRADAFWESTLCGGEASAGARRLRRGHRRQRRVLSELSTRIVAAGLGMAARREPVAAAR